MQVTVQKVVNNRNTKCKHNIPVRIHPQVNMKNERVTQELG